MTHLMHLILEEFIKTIPVYERNTNVDVTLKSSHPAPATLTCYVLGRRLFTQILSTCLITYTQSHWRLLRKWPLISVQMTTERSKKAMG